jgi:ribosomal protein S18 acetylase RimI-like enzyme
MKILPAYKNQSSIIAALIMQAMNYDCCSYFAGPSHSLRDFEQLMISLVEADDSQYSYRNTLTAITDDNQIAGICVSYDGADLHSLRQAFIDGAKRMLNRDFSNMEDETQAGELYLDSLAVDSRYRGKGIATTLLKASISKARKLDLPAAGLLVDCSNPQAERLYTRIGFRYVNLTSWGGHPMKHLQYRILY